MARGYSQPLDPDALGFPDTAARAVYVGQLKKIWEDALGVCYFAMQGYKGIFDLETRAIGYGVGWEDFDRDEAMLAGERYVTLQRLVSLMLDYKREYDFDVSPRLLLAIPTGPGRGRSLSKYLQQWRNEYYAHLGWDPETGVPSEASLRKVGLEGYCMGVGPGGGHAATVNWVTQILPRPSWASAGTHSPFTQGDG